MTLSSYVCMYECVSVCNSPRPNHVLDLCICEYVYVCVKCVIHQNLITCWTHVCVCNSPRPNYVLDSCMCEYVDKNVCISVCVCVCVGGGGGGKQLQHTMAHRQHN